MKKKLADRYNLLGAFLILVGVLILMQLVNLQIVNGKNYDLASQRALTNIKNVTGPRGNIVDRNGITIADDRMCYSVQIVDAGLSNDQLNDMLLRLVSLFKKNGDNYYKNFYKYFTYDNGTVNFGSTLKKSKDKTARLINDMGLRRKSIQDLKTPKDYFNYFRKTRYEISSKYTDAQAYDIMAIRYELSGFSSMKSRCVANDIRKATIAEIEERNGDFPGVSTGINYMRKYNNGSQAAQVLGYIRAIDSDEYKVLKDSGYKMTDYIGKSGIELAAEKYLKGQDGYIKLETDISGKTEKGVAEKPAIPGDKVVLTLDTELQKVAMESLSRNIHKIKTRQDETAIRSNKGDASAGSVVALDVNTGEVLVMANFPTFDPSIFLSGPNDKAAQSAITNLYKNEQRPAMNRAIAGVYPPGSTFKPLVGVAGLEEGVITKDTRILDEGIFYKEGVALKSLEYVNGKGAMGPITLRTALAASNNIFFYKLGNMVGINNLDKWSKTFGLGEKTGIDIGGEVKGARSNPAYHYERNSYRWGYVLTAYSSIGQLYNSFTPIQLANYIATIANGGKHFTPYLIKRAVKYDGTVDFQAKPKYTQIKLKPETIAAVKEGMEAVANSEDGTATAVFGDFYKNHGIRVAAKTGTAQTGNDSMSNNGVFVCYAPADKPRIAIAIVMEHGVQGRFSAPIARDILTEYFHVGGGTAGNDGIPGDEVKFNY